MHVLILIRSTYLKVTDSIQNKPKEAKFFVGNNKHAFILRVTTLLISKTCC